MTQENARRTSHVKAGNRSGAVVALTLMSGLLVACNAHNRGVTNAIPLTNVEDRHPILQAGDFAILDIPVGKGEGRMSTKEKVDVEVFLHGYRKNGAGPLTIATPQGTANEQAAVRRIGQIRTIAFRMGVPEDAILFEPYTPNVGTHSFPVSLKYRAYKMVVPQCGNISRDLAANVQNLPYDNFGCSRQRNLAVMVANPDDLRHPRQRDKRYAPQRDQVLEKYEAGEKTSSQNNEATTTNITDIGN